MIPVLIGNTKIKFIILPQCEAEERQPQENEVLVSIIGKGYETFSSEYETQYKDIIRVVVDDIDHMSKQEDIEKLRGYVSHVINVIYQLYQNDEEVTVTFHCLAGMSRSTAFAVGCAAAISYETLESDINAMCLHVTEKEYRKFTPNPLFIRIFEEELGLNPETLKSACDGVSEHFRTWVKYWDRKENKTPMKTFIAIILYGALMSSAYSQSMIIQRGVERTAPSATFGSGDEDKELIQCSRNSRPPPDCGMDVNTSSYDDLIKVPGLSAASALTIKAGRPYVAISEILEKNYLRQEEFEIAKNYLWIMKASLNYSTRRELMSRLSLSREKADYIVTHRPWSSVDDLAFHGVMSSSTLEIMRRIITIR